MLVGWYVGVPQLMQPITGESLPYRLQTLYTDSHQYVDDPFCWAGQSVKVNFDFVTLLPMGGGQLVFYKHIFSLYRYVIIRGTSSPKKAI